MKGPNELDAGQVYARHQMLNQAEWLALEGLDGSNEVAAPERCSCGHDMDSDLRCLNGRIYGPCASEHCDGPCTDTYGFCNADGCLCEEGDDEA